MSQKQYDIVVFGATSYVGQLLVHYLFETYGVNGDVRWALAGRNSAKLTSLKQQLGSGAHKLPALIADANDANSLQAMAASTRVVASTVGPYALYGSPTVAACVNAGTDYCDLTGEVQWIIDMVSTYESKAKETGARIVHCCGFDSIPSDMGVFHLQQQAQSAFGQAATQVKMRVKSAKGGVSGGTVASIINLAKEIGENPSLRQTLSNHYAICPEGYDPGIRQPEVTAPEFDEDFNAWSAPFVMGSINTRIVQRSNALQNSVYGTPFIYNEAVLTGAGLKGRARAFAVTGGIGGFLAASAIKPSRWFLERFVVPKPGEGPNEKTRNNGFYDMRFVGRTKDGQTIKTKVTGQGDPGYGSTCRILGEAAMSLAFDVPEDVTGGFWTPASLLGEPLLQRLEKNAQLTFERLK